MVKKCRNPTNQPNRNRLVIGQAVNTFGDGLSSAILPLLMLSLTGNSAYLTCSLMLIGVGSALGAPIGGSLADRFGYVRVAVICFVGSALSTVMMVAQDSLWGLVLWASIAGTLLRAGKVARNAYIGVTAGADRVQFRALLRSVLNVSYTLGALLALAVVLFTQTSHGQGLGSGLVYGAALLLDGCTSLVAAALYTKLDPYRQERGAASPSELSTSRLVAFKDRPFVAMSVVLGLVVNLYELFAVVLLVYVVNAHGGPEWLVPASLATLVSLSVLLQVRVSAGVTSPDSAVRTARQGGVFGLCGMGILALTSLADGLGLLVLVFSACILVTCGDVFASAGRWELEMELAEQEHMGQYQGVSDLCNVGVASAVPLVGLVVVAGGPFGWFATLATLAAAAAGLGPLVKKVQRTRM